MSEQTREEALAHFGVRGMKWGQRKQTGSSTKKPSNPDTERRKEVAKQAGKAALKIGVRSAAITGLVALGLPAAVAGASVAALAIAQPELVSAGKSWAKLAMDEAGIHKMSTIERTKETLNFKKQEIQSNIRNRGG